ncbi:hypothetical protein [Winogradskyella thalassocola]|uniref:Uncharacterized protein n=1 Tax=Winogradskyella thalassocola TaxID=262004 RepID=A0A1G7Z556_9FLAO|nr:hypothetical protein [Winogradskyella thalassocola]SDH03725.1 hypothetical protein SAMN04489796_1011229 [Winogradskyella thalassocola]
MKTRITNDIEPKTVGAKRSHFTTRGLLNSNYKRTVKYNFKKACQKSLFGIKQRVKSPRMCKTSHATSMVLKVSVFASVALVACV